MERRAGCVFLDNGLMDGTQGRQDKGWCDDWVGLSDLHCFCQIALSTSRRLSLLRDVCNRR
jgi:hypothetical protein